MKLWFLAVLALALMSCPVALAQTESEPAATTANSAVKKLKENQEQLSAKQAELKALNDKIKSLSTRHDSATNEAELAAEQMAFVSRQLKEAELQYEQTQLNIAVTDDNISLVTQQIEAGNRRMDATRQKMKENMRQLYQYGQTPVVNVVLGMENLSDLMAERRTWQELQERSLELFSELKEDQQLLAERMKEFEQKKVEWQQLKKLQAYQQDDLAKKKIEKDRFLSLKQKEQARFAREIVEARLAREEVEKNIFSLRGAGVELKFSDAWQAARFAGGITGVRPALLLGVLKVETNVGEWLGSGKFPDDMHPGSREAFLRITQQLKMDPYAAPISRRPVTYQGWGGAMGPGQLMPSTWETIAGRVGEIIKKPVPNPYELADALVAVGIMLADRGAANPAKEVEAVARYMAGPNWMYHLWYSSRVLAVAEEYEKSNQGLAKSDPSSRN